jgi:hypothetical protein
MYFLFLANKIIHSYRRLFILSPCPSIFIDY